MVVIFSYIDNFSNTCTTFVFEIYTYVEKAEKFVEGSRILGMHVASIVPVCDAFFLIR